MKTIGSTRKRLVRALLGLERGRLVVVHAVHARRVLGRLR